MAIDPKININENQVIFKSDFSGHKHDGLTSALIDTTKYSLFDFPIYPVAPVGTQRRRLEETNVLNLKTFIVNAIEERVLHPKGIKVQANSITANEIVSGTITVDQLTSNLVLVNHVIKSNNFVSGNTGWAINSEGYAEFGNATIRGTIYANTGSIGTWEINNTGIYHDSSFGGETYTTLFYPENLQFYTVNEEVGYKNTSIQSARIVLSDDNGQLTIEPESINTFNFDTSVSRNVQWVTVSDYRLKNNVKKLNNSLNIINNLNPVEFNWANNSHSYGFIAHELQDIIPELVENKKDQVDEKGIPQYQSVDYPLVVPFLTGAIQELIVKIEELESRLQTLEGV